MSPAARRRRSLWVWLDAASAKVIPALTRHSQTVGMLSTIKTGSRHTSDERTYLFYCVKHGNKTAGRLIIIKFLFVCLFLFHSADSVLVRTGEVTHYPEQVQGLFLVACSWSGAKSIGLCWVGSKTHDEVLHIVSTIHNIYRPQCKTFSLSNKEGWIKALSEDRWLLVLSSR